MTAATLTAVPRDLVKRLHATAPSVSTADKPAVVGWLRRVFVDFDALTQHIDLLQELSRAAFVYPTPRRDRRPGYTPPSPPTGFRHSIPLPPDRLGDLLDRGPAALADSRDEDLSALLLNPAALYDAYDAIDEVQPEAWVDEMMATGREFAQSSPSETRPAQRPAGNRRLPVAVGWAAALAACLMIGLAAGRWVIPGAGAPEGASAKSGTVTAERYASAGFRKLDVRGDEADAAVDVESDLDGFATIVLLTPNEKPLVLPGTGGSPIRVRPGARASSGKLPPLWRDSARVLVVVTPTRAADSVRDLLKARPAGPDQVEALKSYLRDGLAAENVGPVVFAEAVPGRVAETK